MPDTPRPHVDDLKRTFKGSTVLIDFILGKERSWLALSLQVPEVSMVTEENSKTLRTALEAISLDSACGDDPIAAAIAWQGSFVAGSTQWVLQDSEDLFLVQALVRCLPAATLRDIPVYLPNRDAEVPIRLLTTELSNGMELLMLVGQQPPLSEVPALVHRHLRPVHGVIKGVADTICLPPSNMFAGFDRLRALLAVQKSPPRCMGVTTAVDAFDRAGAPSTGAPPPSSRVEQSGALASLASFALCSSSMVDFRGRQESAETVPKHSDVRELQMVLPNLRLIHVNRGEGLHIYAAAPLEVAAPEAEEAARRAVGAIRDLMPLDHPYMMCGSGEVAPAAPPGMGFPDHSFGLDRPRSLAWNLHHWNNNTKDVKPPPLICPCILRWGGSSR
eukprot:CAMPEP_0177626940 /NCGR_PEP_ID=MMETSP0419_2-20121207/30934_1 /TAXON_ID=582737 /ORGANISM="Tetraselmis sp., Strain GSL018" /LENGTH=388 /DNA_ID=CAMNT_0019128053 /DNA_START=381 /DNA_END=1549 /DNA_ORIENTATION=-